MGSVLDVTVDATLEPVFSIIYRKILTRAIVRIE